MNKPVLNRSRGKKTQHFRLRCDGYLDEKRTANPYTCIANLAKDGSVRWREVYPVP
jgi:hypothetical protein